MSRFSQGLSKWVWELVPSQADKMISEDWRAWLFFCLLLMSPVVTDVARWNLEGTRDRTAGWEQRCCGGPGYKRGMWGSVNTNTIKLIWNQGWESLTRFQLFLAKWQGQRSHSSQFYFYITDIPTHICIYLYLNSAWEKMWCLCPWVCVFSLT